MLTRKDIKAVAEIIRNATCVDGVVIWIRKEDFVEEIAGYFATQNPHFDRERFMQVCGLTE